MPADFDNVYLDTEVLTTQGWPRESSEMHIFLFLARLLKVTVFLPEGVEIERRRQWPGALKGLIKKLKTNWESLNSSCIEFAQMDILVGSVAPITIPGEHDVARSYDRLAGGLKKRWGIQTIPLATRDSTDLFKLAVNKKAAFEEHGKGIQDTLIYFSVLDHLQGTSSRRGAFVSGDDIFHSDNVRELTPAGLEIESFRKLSSVIERLKDRLTEDPRRAWDLDIHTAERALEKLAPVLGRFVLEQIASRPIQLGELHKWASISGVEVINIKNVQTPPPSDRVLGQLVRLSFDLSVRITVSSLGYGTEERTLEADVKALNPWCFSRVRYSRLSGGLALSEVFPAL